MHTHCNKDGHFEEECFKKHGYPDWFKEMKNRRGKKPQSLANNVNISQSCESEASQARKGNSVDSYTDMVFRNNNWIIDTGASSHISGNLSLFSQLKEAKVPNYSDLRVFGCYVTNPDPNKKFDARAKSESCAGREQLNEQEASDLHDSDVS
ncbi:retrovirus-related Pol polyprotein from transposon TNT 1-94 [Senna tora]|uniref:Retrovirus-related Pol polyprotein from transposon TNT 1-94 n=1 Tax=Senna tora TaxID=362788 RepID=A0A834W7C6_9FABA|nr:retrovirus-related Pol polyprotein from transposon TNT 1-94 [Senna tora]